MYNLTDNQKGLAKWLVENVKEGNLEEEFKVKLRPTNFEIIDKLDKLLSTEQEIKNGTITAPESITQHRSLVFYLRSFCSKVFKFYTLYLELILLPHDMEVELLTYKGTKQDYQNIGMTQSALQALVNSDLLRSHVLQHAKNLQLTIFTFTPPLYEEVVRYNLTGDIYKAVDNDFNSPDTSFIDYLNPLANPSGFDEVLTRRCFPILATGGSDPILWDSAVRTAGVILEERLHDVGAISDSSQVGRSLVNAIFGRNGTLASRFTVDAEREGYRELYSGIVGAFRNPSAHRLVDPSPEEGGAFIVFVNLLLKKLEELR